MDTWTGPREPIAKKIPLSSRLWTSAIDRHSVRPYLEGYRIKDHCPSSHKYPNVPRLSTRIRQEILSKERFSPFSCFFPLFFFFLNLFLVSHDWEISPAGFSQQQREARESTSNRLPIQSYDNYFAQPLRTRCTNERITPEDSGFSFSFFFFLFSFTWTGTTLGALVSQRKQ